MGRSVSHVTLGIDVLWTEDEEAALAAEAAAAELYRVTKAEETRQTAALRISVLQKFGLTEEEIGRCYLDVNVGQGISARTPISPNTARTQ